MTCSADTAPLPHPNTTGTPAPRPTPTPVRRCARPIRVLAQRPLIVHSAVAWERLQGWPQSLFVGLARHHPVLFVTDPAYTACEQPALHMAQPHPNIVHVMPVLPPDRAPDLDRQCATVAPLLRHALADHPMTRGRFNEAIQWFRSAATAPCFLGEFGTIGALYEWPDTLSCAVHADLQAREHLLLRAARLILGSHRRIQEWAKQLPQTSARLSPLDAGALAAHGTSGAPDLAIERNPRNASSASLFDPLVTAIRAQLLDVFRPPATAALPRGFVAASALAWASE